MTDIIFMGTPYFAVEILEGLLASDYQVVAVVTQPDRPVGRKRVLTPPPVKVLAQSKGIPVYQPEKLSQSPDLQTLIDLDADMIITAAYGQFVPNSLLTAVDGKAINVHASLLPKYRGGAPIHYAIWQGESETGVSIMYMTDEMDAGDVLAQRSIPIQATDNVQDLFDKLALLGRRLLLDILPRFIENQIVATSQDPEQVSFAPVITREQEEINWQLSAQAVDRHVRAFCPFPSTHTYLNQERVKIWQGHPVHYRDAQGQLPGTIVAIKDQTLIVQCGQDSFYAVLEWQESGKKRTLLSDYLKTQSGQHLIGQRFCSATDQAN
ncbi:methionyl-tRNA formyltransferase [Vaginisenegalia massiliensis]|uniref:methionyl-tRNA formyltransferase n=1 Tax=Vaginisenegalia massiliensis TaxID=2058294 RepID=UPI000F545D33|nr:methionyl-tRNA formyltransferase [Vaginisenegalia massiliensis]